MNTTPFKPPTQSSVPKLSLAGLAAGVLTLGLVVAFQLAASPQADAYPRSHLVYDATGTMLTAIVPGGSNHHHLDVPVPVYDATATMWAAVPWLKP